MKNIFLILFCLTSFNSFAGKKSSGFRALNERSDTIDIIHTTISLDLSTSASTQEIVSRCDVKFVPLLNNINQINFDLLNLSVDSVIGFNNQILSFSYSDSLLLKIFLPVTLNSGDTSIVKIFYHGHPTLDVTAGGFYIQPPYFFNIGVAYDLVPHTFGRSWFPCFDNFVERSTYEFFITVPTGKTATSNGLLIDTLSNGNNTTTWHWNLNEAIPSYLACVSVSDYAIVKTSFAGLIDTIPVWLAANPNDTNAMKNSFIHLEDAFHAFENRWGPYRWEKIGYSIVPFNGGAMEHATNISYPLFGINGSTTYESVMAHELSHHWFGDLVTCSTAEDMWLNEGWAVYCEFIFAEWLYGAQAYSNAVAANHNTTVHFSNLKDGGYFPLSGMPQNITYGNTTYKKGGDVAHTLRAYMGDTFFFSCIKNYLQDNQYTSKNSVEFRDYLENCSGINLHPFFDGWVFDPGFPQFGIDSITSEINGGWNDVSVFIRQKLNNAPEYFQQVPFEITFMDSSWNKITESLKVSGPCTIYKTKIPINPDFVCLDLNQKISDSETDDSKTIKTTGFNNFTNAKMNLSIQSISDSAFVRIEHYYVYADGFKTPHPGLHISHERYWKVDGIFPSGFDSKAIIIYNGTTPAQVSLSSGAYLDDELITNSEDSLVLFYRLNPSYDWQIESDIILNIQGSTSNKTGQITINHLKKGEYAFGIRQWNKVDSILPSITDTCTLVLNSPEKLNLEVDTIFIYPNPAGNSFFINGNLKSISLIEIFDDNGRKLEEKIFNKGPENLEFITQNWLNGLYFIKVSTATGDFVVKKLVVIK